MCTIFTGFIYIKSLVETNNLLKGTAIFRTEVDEYEELIFKKFVVKIIVQKETSYFEIDGKRASRKQFPLQNAFSLTVHKTQGLTLPHITISIDENIFAKAKHILCHFKVVPEVLGKFSEQIFENSILTILKPILDH